MADYGITGLGTSLREALNSVYPMSGLGNISTAFPPTSPPAPGAPAPQPAAPAVPLPPPRPRFLPPNVRFGLPQNMQAGGGGPQVVAPVQGATSIGPQFGIEGGGLSPRDYVARLGLGVTRSF